MTNEPQPAYKSVNLLALAQPIAQAVQSKFIWLWDAAIERNATGQGGLPAHHNHAFDVEWKRASENEVVVTVRFVWRSASPDQLADSSARIAARFVIGYESPSLSASDDEHLEAFAKLNGVFNAWPYWREYVQSTSARLGLPVVFVPVLTVSNLIAAYLVHEAASSTAVISQGDSNSGPQQI